MRKPKTIDGSYRLGLAVAYEESAHQMRQVADLVSKALVLRAESLERIARVMRRPRVRNMDSPWGRAKR